MNLELAVLLLAGRGLLGIVLVLAAASRTRAVGARDPQVGRASVEVDGELCPGRANGDLARPLRVLIVGERLRAGVVGALLLPQVLGHGLEVHERRTLGEGAVALEVSAKVPLVLAAKFEPNVRIGIHREE